MMIVSVCAPRKWCFDIENACDPNHRIAVLWKSMLNVKIRLRL